MQQNSTAGSIASHKAAKRIEHLDSDISAHDITQQQRKIVVKALITCPTGCPSVTAGRVAGGTISGALFPLKYCVVSSRKGLNGFIITKSGSVSTITVSAIGGEAYLRKCCSPNGLL
jgi:hypothetical protein